MPHLGQQASGSKRSGDLIHVVSSQKAVAAAETRVLIECVKCATLGTTDRQSSAPYVSLVSIASGPGHVPILLLSDLAQHTQNLVASDRASLLLAANSSGADPLSVGRVTLTGRVLPVLDVEKRAAYLVQHPSSTHYADFGDFRFYQFHIENAHFIGGFGRIVALSRDELVQS